MSSGWILHWVQDVIFMTIVPSLRHGTRAARWRAPRYWTPTFWLYFASFHLTLKLSLLEIQVRPTALHSRRFISRLCDSFRLCKCGQEYDGIAPPDGKTALLKGPCNSRTWMDLCRLIPVLIIQISWGFMFLFFILHRCSICKKSAAVKAMCVCFSTLIFGCFLTSW